MIDDVMAPAHARRFARLSLVAGMLGMIAGAACLAWPGHSVWVVTLLVAAALFAAAAATLISGLRVRRAHGSGALMATGTFGIVVALLIAWHPAMSTSLLVSFVGLVLGGAGLGLVWLAGAWRVISGRWAMAQGAVGAVAVLLGVYLLLAPAPAARVLGVLLGLASILLGAAFVLLAAKLRQISRSASGAGSGTPDPRSVTIEGEVVDPPAPGPH
ncbi:Uncharacterized membrane protein HdeD, DUF308 family [Propionibacterium cyclohexanicum]|uniref:Uncharacterized membrane protein HdeD, DUF308 family n=1 Tax=Propionibacterium cyclohexanicum TaxID=64702 RepID=A0A1H9Q3Z6_9ACTN|nr:DUF308 domain-containing protein [Propionibacterium cyclohexanicum]SER55187.1 Uncharacterized membrane protein HdeD, DUF308 family [Propionibacterium cyclohexanicum]